MTVLNIHFLKKSTHFKAIMTIKAESLTSDGKTVHDCHAEVLAR